MKVIRINSEALVAAVSALASRLVAEKGEDAVAREFPELVEAVKSVKVEEGPAPRPASLYDGSGRFGFSGSL